MKPNFLELLRHKHLSLTPVRLGVLEALHEYPHSDASHIFTLVQKKIATTSIQTIYNNLNTLVEHGVIREIKPKGHVSLYETRVCDNHHHIICKKCGHIADTDCRKKAPCLSPIGNHGFTIDEGEIIFWGICPNCQKNPKQKRRTT